MAIDTAAKRRASAGDAPIPDGSLDSPQNRAQSAGDYGFLISAITYDPMAFTLELATLDYILTLSPEDFILLMEDQEHDLTIH